MRGRVYWAYLDTGGQEERKPFLVVSNNHRNRNLGDCLAVRLTTTRKEPRTTIVPLNPDDPLHGYVLCDEITFLYEDELLEDIGALSLATMTSVANGLKAALDLR
ncbi:type II toxin-antitoxin system PemK/MazF family toxin [Nocardiopsis sp. CC223A]|uniref:type II toxin-antitoxin system PemK/MazF family toxin n=1 Tax=Nocardiopsis sp. CC223A TaxID=3044051 RepID=UPI00278BBD6B|nr:type II toxin-antitoxin system PemK/MazF family toxin [Nocardiopsis sp. CC223A]